MENKKVTFITTSLDKYRSLMNNENMWLSNVASLEVGDYVHLCIVDNKEDTDSYYSNQLKLNLFWVVVNNNVDLKIKLERIR